MLTPPRHDVDDDARPATRPVRRELYWFEPGFECLGKIRPETLQNL